MGTKTCNKCGKDKPLSEFHRKTATKDGFQACCKFCASKYNAEYRLKHAEELSNKAAKYYIENREKKLAQAARYYMERSEEIISRITEYTLQRKYGIGMFEYDELLEAQGNGCVICGKTPEENGKRLDVDHNHKTGVRYGGCYAVTVIEL